MKKAALCLMGLTLILSLCACASIPPQPVPPPPPDASEPQTAPPSDASPEHPETPFPAAERLGFEGGNIGASGLVCAGDDGYIYYRSESDGWRLYKAKPDGSEKTKVSDAVPECINVLDGWVYYLEFSDSFSVYKVRTDGTETTKLVDGYCNDLYVAESGMYFNKRDELGAPFVYRADLDGGNMTLLYPEAWLKYYYDGKVYVQGDSFAVYDVASGEEKALADIYVYNVAVDDSGIYYWAVDQNEYRRMDLDGTNERVLLKGGNFYNFCRGALYYVGIGENENGLCHVVNKLSIDSDETTALLEEANAFFDAHGDWVGVTFEQFRDRPETIDPELIEPNEHGEIFVGYSESMGYVYVCGEHLFMRASLRESLLQKGRLDCIARLDGGALIWD